MIIRDEPHGVQAAIRELLASAKGASFSVHLFGGEVLTAYPPIGIGDDYLIMQTSMTPNAHRRLVRLDAIMYIQCD